MQREYLSKRDFLKENQESSKILNKENFKWWKKPRITSQNFAKPAKKGYVHKESLSNNSWEQNREAEEVEDKEKENLDVETGEADNEIEVKS